MMANSGWAKPKSAGSIGKHGHGGDDRIID